MTKGQDTRTRLEMALKRIEHGRPKIIMKSRKLSISAVAEEAEVSAASIHNNYPDIAHVIRTKLNKVARLQANLQQPLLQEKQRNQEIRKELNDIKEQLRKLASENAKLVTENVLLKNNFNRDLL